MRRTSGTVPTTSAYRGQVGVGTLMMLLAMVLVAAIAAGVLIDITGFLGRQSEESGEQSSTQVTDRIRINSKTGTESSGTIVDVEWFSAHSRAR